MRVWKIVAFTVVTGTALPVLLHHERYGLFNGYQMALAFFLWLNAIIAFWEICLFLSIDLVARRHAEMVETFAGRAFARSIHFMSSTVAPRQLLSPSSWTGVWTSYAGFDESYANKSSYGFFVDVGNGFTTLIPSLLVLYGMTYQLLPARVLGIIALLTFYQMWYGTLVYLGSFFFNRRHVGHPLHHLAIIVGLLNGLWLTFPLLGIYAAVIMIFSNSYALFVH
jgi:hypothetical protein